MNEEAEIERSPTFLVARGLSADERKLLLALHDDWHDHFDASQVIAVGRLGSLGLVTFINSYEGPMAKRTERGRLVASLVPPDA